MSEEKRKLSEEHDPAPHVDRGDTIVSTFLEAGEKHDDQELRRSGAKNKNKYAKAKSWMDYWDDRQAIYQAQAVENIETYEPTALERLVALLAYVPLFVFFIPMVNILLFKKEGRSLFVHFHTKQGYNLMITNFFLIIVYGLVLFMFHVFLADPVENFSHVRAYLTYTQGWNSQIVFWFLGLIWAFPLYLMSAGLSRASQGEWKPLPLIGKDMLAD
ncbi:MAG: DUF4870 domain-containing protein [Coriobacteriia bacterium]|nr:DUF4870 domain-containing protein [Coriobacteriia bacterium]